MRRQNPWENEDVRMMSSANKRPAIERDRYFIKRLNEGVRITTARVADRLEKMKAEPTLHHHMVEMLERSNGQSYYLLGPRETAPVDRPLDGFAVAYLELGAGTDFPEHYHVNRCAFFYVVEGRGKVILDGETFPIEKGDSVFLKAQVSHQIVADPGPLHYLAVQRPDVLEPDPDGTFDFVFK
jgi:mannose-6-phosphate isomerase-like protein (cupin superfamily)